ncbi:MAG: hypothetical protein H7241_08450 [Novosphingobium sp.]|nr:hypothetical protein [Novosphingobium sp.]
MSPEETMALLVLIVGIISIAGIIGEAYKRRLDFKQRSLELKAQQASEHAAQSAATAERLEQRVRVLERIATDKSATLASQIEDMREPAM